MANQAHLDDYAATGKVEGLGYEIFAESYARAMMNLDMPEPLRAFWEEENKSLAFDAEWREVDHPRAPDGKFGAGSGTGAAPKSAEKSEADPKKAEATRAIKDRLRLLDSHDFLTKQIKQREALSARGRIGSSGQQMLKMEHDRLAQIEKELGGKPDWGGELKKAADAIAEQHGFDSSKISIQKTPKTFDLNGKQYNYAGAATLGTGRIELWPDQIKPSSVENVVAHEIMHHKYHAFLNALLIEENAVRRAASNAGKNLWYVNGLLKEPHDKQFPLLQAHRQVMAVGRDAFAKSDGVSPYSKMWWKAATAKPPAANDQQAFHETLAEMAAAEQRTGQLPGAPEWRALYALVNGQWDKSRQAKPEPETKTPQKRDRKREAEEGARRLEQQKRLLEEAEKKRREARNEELRAELDRLRDKVRRKKTQDPDQLRLLKGNPVE